MPFSPEVRNEALVRAARHCCVCHRWKGVRVEVHHIIQEADGGPNTVDNAIALCFDCHADAGHYNPRHPKGTKFSPQELRLARERWYAIVERGPIQTPAEPTALYCRYLLCREYEAIREVSGGNLADCPVANAFLVRTPVLNFLAAAVRLHPEKYRLPRQWGESYQSESDYLLDFPQAVKTMDSFEHGQQWLEYQRVPSLDELREKLAPRDYPTRVQIDAGWSPAQICDVRAFTDGCGNVLLQEEYRLRSLWALYLVATNDSERRVRFLSLKGQADGKESATSIVGLAESRTLSSIVVECPAAEVPPGSSVVFPVMTILGPIGDAADEALWSHESEVVQSGQYQTLSHSAFPNLDIRECYGWGPIIRSPKIRYVDNGVEQVQDVHEFDLTNVYVQDRYWAMGSCPHIFAITADGEIRYLGELFAGPQATVQEISLHLKMDVMTLVIAELEDEITTIHHVKKNGLRLLKGIDLDKGRYIALSVAGGDVLTIVGSYRPHGLQPPYRVMKEPRRIRSLINNFIEELR